MGWNGFLGVGSTGVDDKFVEISGEYYTRQPISFCGPMPGGSVVGPEQPLNFGLMYDLDSDATSGNNGDTFALFDQVDAINPVLLIRRPQSQPAGYASDYVIDANSIEINLINSTAYGLPVSRHGVAMIAHEPATSTSMTGPVTIMQIVGSSSYPDDASAEAGGVALGELYRNGNAVKIRVV